MISEFIKEHRNNNEFEIHGGALVEKSDYDEWLSQLLNNSDKVTVDKNWVISSTFLAMRKSDNKMIGIIDIRHELNSFLSAYGGHIGLSVRPSERKKGYATTILNLGLDFCKTINLQKVMLACYKENTASRKTIERCGGILEKEFALSEMENFPIISHEPLDKIVQIFWITLS